MRVKTQSVFRWLCFITIIAVTVSLIFIPKLAGPFSGLGNAVHEIRMDILGVEHFQHPPWRMEPKALRDFPFRYQQYRACQDCPIPMYIGTAKKGWYGARDTVIRIMNIRPKYRYGMELPAGDYDVEIQLDPEKKNTTNRFTLSLTPDNNVFIFEPQGAGGVTRVEH